MLAALTFLALLSLAAWLVVALRPSRPWDMQPVAEDEPVPEPVRWPPVVAVVPARNEADSLPRTLPALLAQRYPGSFRVVLVDDRSTDGTAEVARRLARDCGREEGLEVVQVGELPEGWAGKPHAMERGRRAAQGAQRVLFTDADILHAGDSVAHLVAAATAHDIALESRMARLSCRHAAEKLLIPPFVWFFNLLYPMRRANDPGDALAAAAGGCMLADAALLERLGGLSCIKDRIIDDVSLARAVKGAGGALHLALSRGEVTSLREYEHAGDVWRMVRRNAFTELRCSWLRLAACMASLALTFLVPLMAVAAGAGAALAGGGAWAWSCLAAGGAAWTLSALLFLPAVRFFGLHAAWAPTLPLAGLLYGAMTLDSARLHVAGRAEAWRSPS